MQLSNHRLCAVTSLPLRLEGHGLLRLETRQYLRGPLTVRAGSCIRWSKLDTVLAKPGQLNRRALDTVLVLDTQPKINSGQPQLGSYNRDSARFGGTVQWQRRSMIGMAALPRPLP